MSRSHISPAEWSIGTVPSVQELACIEELLAPHVADYDQWLRAVPEGFNSGDVSVRGSDVASAVAVLDHSQRRRESVVRAATVWVPAPPPELFYGLPSSGACIHHYRSGAEEFAISVREQLPWQPLGAGSINVTLQSNRTGDLALVLNGVIAAAGASHALRANGQDSDLRLDALTDQARPWPSLQAAIELSETDAVWFVARGGKQGGPLSVSLGVPSPPHRLRLAFARLYDVLPEVALWLSSVSLDPDQFSDALNVLEGLGVESEWGLSTQTVAGLSALGDLSVRALGFSLPLLPLQIDDTWAVLRVDYGPEDIPEAGMEALEWEHDGQYRLNLWVTGQTWADHEKARQHVVHILERCIHS